MNMQTFKSLWPIPTKTIVKGGQTRKYFHRVKLEKSTLIIRNQFLQKVCLRCAAPEIHGSLSPGPYITELK